MAGLPKNQIRSPSSIEQATFEDNADARRVLLVDQSGASVGPGNGLPVYIVDAGSSGNSVQSKFAEITNIAIGATETILTHTVLSGTDAHLLKIEVSGSNIATYNVLINSVLYARTRTYFGADLTAVIDFGQSLATSPKLLEGTVIEVQVTNYRPTQADFDARLQYIEVPNA